VKALERSASKEDKEMQVYRVEYNYGSRYFDDLKDAKRYFDSRAGGNLDVELWVVRYGRCSHDGHPCALQKLLAFYYW